MSVLLEDKPAHFMYCPQKPEENNRSPGMAVSLCVDALNGI